MGRMGRFDCKGLKDFQQQLKETQLSIFDM